MSEYTPTTDEVRDGFARSDYPPEVLEARFDRWLAAEKAKAWSEGAKAGLDRGLDIAELVHQGHGRLDLTRVPAPPGPNPYAKGSDDDR